MGGGGGGGGGKQELDQHSFYVSPNLEDIWLFD